MLRSSGLTGQNILWNPKIPIDLFLDLLYIFQVLSDEGALLEAILKWDRAKAWLGRGNLNQPDAAPGDVPRKHALGRPWVSVRP